MKSVDLGSVFEIATGPIQSMQCARHHLQGFGKIHSLRRVGFGNQAPPAQHALDGRERRQGFLATHFAQLASDRTCTDQANFLFHQATARLDNELHHPGRGSPRRMMRSPRMTVQTRNTLLIETSLPFVQPGATARHFCQSLLLAAPSQAHADRLPAQSKLLFLIHVPSLLEKA